MSDKENNSERFDGFPVTLYDGRFAGGFDLDEQVAVDMSFDDVVTFLVTTRVSGASFDETKMGDVKRTNKFAVVASVALDPRTATAMMHSVGENAPEDMSQIDGQTNIYDVLDPVDDWEDTSETEPVLATVGAPLTGTADPVLRAFLDGG